MNFQKTNNITGWIAFGIALLVYWLTFEETASYWDCGEFIAVSYKLEVPHPPGAPLFLMLGRIFSFLAFGDVTKVAYWINFLSVLSSAFTILFLFWSITLIGRKLIGVTKIQDLTNDQTWMLMGAGLVGSLAYTFSDSFWFSAVEAEVYAMSSFFTALVVWGVLKWDVIEDESKANRWLILIAYMIGLSIGVHMLNLVTLPALALIIYFKKYKATPLGIFITLGIGGFIVLFINDLIVPGLPSIAGNFEVFFVNTLGLPFGSGALVFGLLFAGALLYGIYYTHTNNKPLLNTFLLATTFILIGYCSYAAIIIRSNFDTPINEDAPKDIMSFVRYLKREQYGSRPLVTGPYFTARPQDIEFGAAVYVKGKNKYEISERKFDYVYAPGEKTLFPRAWSPEHAESYRSILGLAEGQKPTFFQDKFIYMLNQQIGHMYVRYFFWNFAGRESDEQGADWMGPNHWFEKVPAAIANNKARNNFFMIPFLLGLIGMFWQIVKDTKNFAVVGMLFIMMGLAIVIYLNSPPVEPRERDYIYAGSTYAYTFWIGLSVIAICEAFKFIKNQKVATIAATLIGLSAPALMAEQGWDDHNRSNRFFSADSGKNYLASCAKDGILFTGGDNDTFMLWYDQEVEGYRTDLRVVVLSYYNTDWYIDQTMRQAYESTPFTYTLSLHDYRQGGPNDYLRYSDMKIKSIDLKQYLELLKQNNKNLRYDDSNIVPSKVLTLDINKEEVIKKGIIPKDMEDLVVKQMQFRLTKNSIEKKDLAFLDLLATSDWNRPIYLNHTSLAQLNFDMSDYAVLEGNAYRILPIKKPNPDQDFVNTEIAYDNMINKFQYRGLDNDKLYFTDDYRGFVLNHRSSLYSLAESLIDKGDLKRAQQVLEFSMAKMPDKAVPYDHTAVVLVDLLYRVGEKEKATEVATVVGSRANEMATYLIAKEGLSLEVRRNIYVLGNLYQTLYKNGENDLGKKLEDEYTKQIESLQVRRTKRTDY